MLSSPLTQIPSIPIGSTHMSTPATVGVTNAPAPSVTPAVTTASTTMASTAGRRRRSSLASQSQPKISPNSMLETMSDKKMGSTLINIGSRKSRLAIIQSELVSDLIVLNFPQLETKITSVSTLGDQIQNRPLYSFGGKSLWTKELELLLYEKIGDFDKIDLIVHSLKDMPTNLPEGFELGCILKREDPRDAVIFRPDSPYKKLADLPPGAVVGTSSVRRSAQLLKSYPHLKFESVRGSLETRTLKLDKEDSQYSALLLAAAGMLRINMGHRISQYLDEDIMYHAVGQGALGVEIRLNDTFIKQICKLIRDDNSTYCCLLERALLRYLEGGCSVPIGCTTRYDDETQMLQMKAIVVSVDGTQYVEQELTGKVTCDLDLESLGCQIGKMFIANGLKLILDEIDYDKINELKQVGLSSANLLQLSQN